MHYTMQHALYNTQRRYDCVVRSTVLGPAPSCVASSAAQPLHVRSSASACVLPALQRLNGYVCESSAEEFTIAFACARDALRFALLLQMDLLDLAWPSGTTHR